MSSTRAPLPTAPAWATAMRRFSNWLSVDFGGGPRPWKFAWVVNFHKGSTFLVLGALMAWYGNTSTVAWVYLALHGTYGLLWLVKDLAFPDPSWQVRVTVGGAINATLAVLMPYWLFGWLLLSSPTTPAYPMPAGMWYALCVSLGMFGTALMIAADAQKYFTLRARPGLITDGVYRYIRHPNYLGEMMFYGSLALLVWHWFPVLVLGYVWGGLFATNMVLKEVSLSRYPEWPAYRKRSWWLLPLVF